MLGMWREKISGVVAWLTGSVDEARATASSIASGSYPWARFRKRWTRRTLRAVTWIGQRAGDAMDWAGITKPSKSRRAKRDEKAAAQTSEAGNNGQKEDDGWTSEGPRSLLALPFLSGPFPPAARLWRVTDGVVFCALCRSELQPPKLPVVRSMRWTAS